MKPKKDNFKGFGGLENISKIIIHVKSYYIQYKCFVGAPSIGQTMGILVPDKGTSVLRLILYNICNCVITFSIVLISE